MSDTAIWRKNLDGHVWEILNPNFFVCARLWVMSEQDFGAPYYLCFYPYTENATPIIADDLEHAKEIAMAVYQLYDGNNIDRSRHAQP